MKPYSADTEPFRSIDDIWELRVKPLTVLFGRNNAGKSNALTALTRPLGLQVDEPQEGARAEAGVSGSCGRFWVVAPEDGTAWDMALRREVYLQLIHELIPREHTPFSRPPSIAMTRKELDDVTVEALAENLVELELAQFGGLGDSEVHTDSADALRELLRNCLFGFTENEVQLGFPPSALTPEIVALVRKAAQRFPLGVPRGWDVGMELEDETAVLIDQTRPPFRPVLLSADWSVSSIESEIEAFISRTERMDDTDITWPQQSNRMRPWLVEALGQVEGGRSSYKVNSSVMAFVDELTDVTNRLLPRFLRGKIEVCITSPRLWDRNSSRVVVNFFEEGRDQCAGNLSEEGSGVARWSAVALRLAMRVIERVHAKGEITPNSDISLDGFVIVLDEPEAHLHPAAVRDVVEWCYTTVQRGACVLVATHHEEFLANLRDESALIHVTKPDRPTASRLRQVESSTIDDLRQLAKDVGLSAGAALGLYRAVLFVEGPLDVAVLDEYAGTRLESAGVLLLPIHGTRNLEGLVTSEIIQRLECRQGVLLDATDVATLRDRPNKKLSSEEKKILRVIDIAKSKGQPEPKIFGVQARDLLYSLDERGLREFGAPNFPGWESIDGESRAYFGADGSQSVNWKAYVHVTYGIPLESEEGVRGVVRWLDMNGYQNPQVERLLGEVLEWAVSSFETGIK